MRVAALRVDLHIPAAQSLKEKRAALRPVVAGIRKLGSYSVAEVANQDFWQRATLGVATVARDGKALEMQIDALHRYLDACLEVEVVDVRRSDVEEPE